MSSNSHVYEPSMNSEGSSQWLKDYRKWRQENSRKRWDYNQPFHHVPPLEFDKYPLPKKEVDMSSFDLNWQDMIVNRILHMDEASKTKLAEKVMEKGIKRELAYLAISILQGDKVACFALFDLIKEELGE